MKNGDMPAMPLSIEQAENLYGFIRGNYGEPDGLGLTKREYFMAHAPAEPSPWFEPEMEGDCPRVPTMPDSAGAYVREFWQHMTPDSQPNLTDEERQFVIEAQRQQKASIEWSRERARQHYIQWPRAWADALLESLEKSNEQ